MPRECEANRYMGHPARGCAVFAAGLRRIPQFYRSATTFIVPTHRRVFRFGQAQPLAPALVVCSYPVGRFVFRLVVIAWFARGLQV